MNEKPENIERRKENVLNKRNMLKTLLLGAGTAASAVLPDRWVKPVISSAILPAHAVGTTQLAECNSPAAAAAGVTAGYSGSETVSWEIILPTTEATDGTPVDVEIVSGVELEAELELTGTVQGGIIAGIEISNGAFSESEVDVGTGADFEVNVDIGDDGTVDCSFETTITD